MACGPGPTHTSADSSVLQCVSMCYCMLPCAHGGVAELLHGLRASAYGSDAAEWCGCCHMAFCSVQLLEI